MNWNWTKRGTKWNKLLAKTRARSLFAVHFILHRHPPQPHVTHTHYSLCAADSLYAPHITQWRTKKCSKRFRWRGVCTMDAFILHAEHFTRRKKSNIDTKQSSTIAPKYELYKANRTPHCIQCRRSAERDFIVDYFGCLCFGAPHKRRPRFIFTQRAKLTQERCIVFGLLLLLLFLLRVKEFCVQMFGRTVSTPRTNSMKPRRMRLRQLARKHALCRRCTKNNFQTERNCIVARAWHVSRNCTQLATQRKLISDSSLAEQLRNVVEEMGRNGNCWHGSSVSAIFLRRMQFENLLFSISRSPVHKVLQKHGGLLVYVPTVD